MKNANLKTLLLIFIFISFILLDIISCMPDDPPIEETYSISGTIKLHGGTTLDGATVSLSGDATEQTTTDASGNYTFTEIEAGDYTISITKNEYTIIPNNYTGITKIIDSNIENFNFTAFDDNTTPLTYIYQIQGAAHQSPLNESTVTNVLGVVTAIREDKGYYIQNPKPDDSDGTSEGIYVYLGEAPTISTGDWILIDALVDEFGYSGHINITELKTVTSTVIVDSSYSLPEPIIIGDGGRTIPTEIISNARADVNTDTTFDPTIYGVDFFESLEGMYVQVNNPLVTGDVHSLFNEFHIVADNGNNVTTKTSRGGVVISEGDLNPERILIDYGEGSGNIVDQGGEISVVIGDTFDGPIKGIIDYSDSYISSSLKSAPSYKIFPTEILPSIIPANLPRETTTITSSANKLTVATFNVENLDYNDDQEKFDDLADTIVNALNSPDIIALAEIQDNDGETNSGTVEADLTYGKLITTISALPGAPSTYDFRDIAPINNSDGGAPGSNIRVGFLFRTDRVTFVDIAGGTATSTTTVIDNGGIADISYSPGRVDPTNAAFDSSRKPLIGKFEFNGETIFLIANHFSSKRGDGPLYGDVQPPVLDSETKRNQQTQVVHDFVDQIFTIQADANVIVLGDMNDFSFSTPMLTLKGDPQVLFDLSEDLLPQDEQYSYVYKGNSQELDHILVSSNMKNTYSPNIDVVHRYAEYLYGERHSDHDPLLISLNISELPDTTPPSWISTYPKVTDVLTTTVKLKVETNEIGNAYYKVYADGTTAPTSAELKSSGTSVSITEYTESIIDISGLSDNTAYDLYVVAEDSIPNIMSTPTLVEFTTLDGSDITPPEWITGYPNIDNIAATSLDLKVKINENGRVYYKVYADGATAPTSAELKSAGTQLDVTADTELVETITGLTADTSYDIYIVAEDLLSNIQASPNKQDVTTSTSTTVDLTGWTVELWQNGALKSTINLSGEYEKGKYIVIVRNLDDISAWGNAFTPALSTAETENIVEYVKSSPEWQNNGTDDEVKLIDPSIVVVDTTPSPKDKHKTRQSDNSYLESNTTNGATGAPDTITGYSQPIYIFEVAEKGSSTRLTNYQGNYVLLYIPNV